MTTKHKKMRLNADSQDHSQRIEIEKESTDIHKKLQNPEDSAQESYAKPKK